MPDRTREGAGACAHRVGIGAAGGRPIQTLPPMAVTPRASRFPGVPASSRARFGQLLQQEPLPLEALGERLMSDGRLRSNDSRTALSFTTMAACARER
jgi:hypothetical protein